MIYTWFWTCVPMAVCHCGYSRCRYPTTYRRAHRWHGDCIFPMWWPGSGTSGESCLIRIGEDVSIWGRFVHQTCNDLRLEFGICRILQATLISEAGLFRHRYRQVLVLIPGIRCFGRHHVSSYDVHAIWNKVGRLFAITLSKLWHSGPHSWVPVCYS